MCVPVCTAGLYLASLAVHLHSEAQRYVPEPLCFAVQLLQRALPAGSEQAVPAGGSHQRQLDSEEPRWLAIVASDAGSDSLPATAEDIEPLELARVLSAGSGSSSSASGAEGGAEYWRSAGFKTTAAAAAARLIGRCAELLAGNAALPEVLAPAQQALAAIVAAAEAAAAPPEAPPPAAGKKQRKLKGKAAAAAAPAPAPAAQAQQPAASLAPGLVQLCRQVLAQVEAAAEAARGARRPMYNLQLLKVGEKRQFNPRFEEGFATGKDYDPDRWEISRHLTPRVCLWCVYVCWEGKECGPASLAEQQAPGKPHPGRRVWSDIAARKHAPACGAGSGRSGASCSARSRRRSGARPESCGATRVRLQGGAACRQPPEPWVAPLHRSCADPC